MQYLVWYIKINQDLFFNILRIKFLALFLKIYFKILQLI